MANDDRKCLYPFFNRMTSLRVDRMRQLMLDIIQRLMGHKGGFIGLRFATDSRGRGVAGEGLANPIPPDKRIVKVHVGNWLFRARDEADLYREGAAEWGGKDALDVAMMTEWGRRLDADGNEVPLTQEEMGTDEIHEENTDNVREGQEKDGEESEEEEVEEEESLLPAPFVPGKREKWKFKSALAENDEAAVTHRRKLAYKLGAHHYEVTRV